MSLSARTEDLAVEQMQDDLCVYDFRNQKCHALNKTSAQVWRLCDGKSSVDEIASGLGRELGAAADVDVTLLALKQLRNNGLLEGTDPRLEKAASVSRRSVMKKFGIAAAASAPILLPLIESIVAPTPAAAISGLTTLTSF